ncbi:MAG: DNA polymerase I [Selenomonadaceae bacterium]|nr:DNA polymerase I [Selenomonadaceae bacterium]
MKAKEKLVVIDGSSLLYRAFYAMSQQVMLTAPSGEPIGAVMGFANMLAKILETEAPTGVAIAFDKAKRTFRHAKFPDYKAGRAKTPEELLLQIPILHDFAAACAIPFIEKEGYEADDILGTLATQAAATREAVVVTGDRDALQLIGKNLTVLYNKTGASKMIRYDEATFREEYGLSPRQLIDLKGLMGDKSDNIPGVPGVGIKTATELLKEYGSVAEVLAHIDDISKKKTRELLRQYQEQALLSTELATIERQVPGIEFRPEEFELSLTRDKLEAFCVRYGLNKVWATYQKFLPTIASKPTTAIEALTWTEGVSAEAIASLRGEKTLAVATRYEGTAPFAQAQEIMLAAADKLYRVTADSDNWGAVVELIRSHKSIVVFDSKAMLHTGILPDYEASQKTKFIKGAGELFPCRSQEAEPLVEFEAKPQEKNIFDVQLAAYLLEPESAKYELSLLCEKYLPDLVWPSGVVGAEKLAYEATALLKLSAKLQEKLTAEGLDSLYTNMELPLAEVLAAMEQNGIKVNREALKQKAVEIGDKIAELEKDIHVLAGIEFKINSPKQLAEILFERLALPTKKKTKTGYSTNAEVLEELKERHPIVPQILAYRLWNKLKSTYLDGLTGLIRADGRLHTSFNQTVTATGRLSSSEPNLQNIPVRREEGRAIRSLFVPGEGFDFLLSADYSQIELRILAHMSGDERLIAAFNDGEDIHARTAAEVFGKNLTEVTPEERRHAKAVNFGIVYGISDFGLAKDLHISRKEAGEYIDKYFTRYAGVKAFLDKIVARAKTDGYVTTLYGRRRYLPDIKSSNFTRRSLAERMAMNTPIQGSAADIIKLAMIRAYGGLKEAGLKSRLLLQVHDELVLEVTEGEIPRVESILRDAMEKVAALSVPLVIDINTGKTWAEAK